MWRFIIIQFLTITLFCNESSAIHEILRVPVGLSPTLNHQQLYVQPSQQLIVYPQLHQQAMPQFYHTPHNLYVPQNPYSAPRYVVQSTGGLYDPVVSYIHHQNPYQTSSFTNFNFAKKLFYQQPEEQATNNPNPSGESADVLIKSGMETEEKSPNDQDKKEVKEMMITSENSMETTEMMETTKNETNKENTTEMVPEAESKPKDSSDKTSL